MNILFVNTFDVSPHLGGTERITDTLCREFSTTFHCKCFLAYYNDIDSKYIRTSFTEKIHLKNHRQHTPLVNFIKKNAIEAIILQGQFRLTKSLKKACEGINVKIIFAHHLFPGVEKSSIRFSYIIPHKIQINNIIPTVIKIGLFPFIKWHQQYKFPHYYNDTYKYADRIVLLSHKLIRPFMDFGKINDDRKFTIIHNALSFNDFFPIEELKRKQKKVLIVSRLVENPKRILFAIKAWEQICQKNPSTDWTLTIVGTGSDEYLYKKYCTDKQLNNISFEGNKNPKPYYWDASIFLMTSQLESWGLTITEAQQFGVVPVALNSYPSLSEIITDSENGIIVEDNNLKAYASAIEELMNDDALRQKYAINAISSSKRFSSENISEQWIRLIQE